MRESMTQGKARLEHSGFRIDYLELRDSDTLMPIEEDFGARPRAPSGSRLSGQRAFDR